MSMRPLERGPDAEMARGTLLIDGRWFSRYEASLFRLVHPVAAYADHATSGMTALDPPDMSWLVAMAAQARFIGFAAP